MQRLPPHVLTRRKEMNKLAYLILLVLLTIGESFTDDPNSSYCLLLASGQATVPFTRVTSPPYRIPDITNDSGKFFSYFDIISPTTMQGTMAFVPAPLSGPIISSSDGSPFLNSRVILAHSADSYRYGCSLTHAFNDEGEALNGSILLIERQGSCPSFATKTLTAASMGVKAILFHGCPLIEGCRDTLSIIIASASMPIPILYVTTSDGYAMRNYLLARRQAFYNQLAANNTLSASSSSTGMGTNSSSGGSSSSSSSTGAASSAIDTSQPLFIRLMSAGALDPVERETLSALVRTGMIKQDLTKMAGQTSLRPWTQAAIDSVTLDPCLNRIAGIYCEQGHIVSIYLSSLGFSGQLGTLFSNFTQLRALELGTNSMSGPISTAFCVLPELRMVSLGRNSFTSLPDCLGSLPSLYYLSANGNQLTYLPTSFPPSIRVLQLNSNWLGRPSTTNSTHSVVSTNWFALPNLSRIDFSNNPLFGSGVTSLPYFTNYSILERVDFNNAGLSGTLLDTAFDGCGSLLYLDLSSNAITGSLPALRGCKILGTLYLNNNGFNSSIPTTWSSLQYLQTLKLNSNRLISPVSTLGAMFNLTVVYLSNNQLGKGQTDVGSFLVSILNNGLQQLYLDSNFIHANWSSSTITPNNAKSLSILNLANNQVSSLPTDLFGLIALSSLDLSWNDLTGALPQSSPSTTLQFLNFVGNPRLTSWPLPSWVTTSTSSLIESVDGTFSCPLLSSAFSVTMQFRVDATFTLYYGCYCSRGTFGYPPSCSPVPLASSVSPFDGFTSSEVGASYDSQLQTRLGRGVVANTTTNSTTPPPPATPSLFGLALPAAVTDEVYGSERLTLGVSTSWVIDLSHVYLDQWNNSVEHTSAGTMVKPPIDPTLLTQYPSRYTPVLLITLRLHLNRAVFDDPTDQIDIFEGDANLKGTRIKSIDGIDSIVSDQNSFGSSTPGYDYYYSDALAALGNDTDYVEVQSFVPMITLHFSSRDVDSMHFLATYTYDFQCPLGFYLPPLDETNTVLRCQPNIDYYSINESLRAAVLAIGSISVVTVIVMIIISMIEWQSVILRAASRRFVMLLLCCLVLLGCGSLLFAVSPSPTPDSTRKLSNVVCAARAWLTGFPLAGILGILFAKTARVVSIFSSVKLVVVSREVGDARVLRTVSFVLLIETIFLIIFTILPLSQGQRTFGEGIHSQSYVVSCSRENGFYIWLGLQLVFFGILMLASVFLAYKTRALPSAFNEASNISSAVLVLLFGGIIMVPLIIFVQDSPEASLLLQGFGTAFLTILLTGILFGPKLYYLYTFSVADQKTLLMAPPSLLGGNTSGLAISLALQVPGAIPSVLGGEDGNKEQPPIIADGGDAQNQLSVKSTETTPNFQLQPVGSSPTMLSGSGRSASMIQLPLSSGGIASNGQRIPTAAELRRINRHSMNLTAKVALNLLSSDVSLAAVSPAPMVTPSSSIQLAVLPPPSNSSDSPGHMYWKQDHSSNRTSSETTPQTMVRFIQANESQPTSQLRQSQPPIIPSLPLTHLIDHGPPHHQSRVPSVVEPVGTDGINLPSFDEPLDLADEAEVNQRGADEFNPFSPRSKPGMFLASPPPPAHDAPIPTTHAGTAPVVPLLSPIEPIQLPPSQPSLPPSLQLDSSGRFNPNDIRYAMVSPLDLDQLSRQPPAKRVQPAAQPVVTPSINTSSIQPAPSSYRPSVGVVGPIRGLHAHHVSLNSGSFLEDDDGSILNSHRDGVSAYRISDTIHSRSTTPNFGDLRSPRPPQAEVEPVDEDDADGSGSVRFHVDDHTRHP